MKLVSTLVVSSALLLSVGSTAYAAAAPKSKIKNIIVMIGDGMGPQQIGLLDSYVRYSKNPVIKHSAFERLANEGAIGISRTEPHANLVVDSAASATQFASGSSAGSEMVGSDYKGDATTTMLEIAQQKGKAVGLVSDTRITHATPAGFAAHEKHRSQENDIAIDLLEHNVDVMLSGGLRYFLPKSANDKTTAAYKEVAAMVDGKVRIKSKRKDDLNLLAQAKKQGYDLAFDKAKLKASKAKKILGLFSYSTMYDAIADHNSANDPARTQPSLTEMTDKALNVLSQSPKGFFLMVEGGLIDYAGHDNDAGTMLHEMLKFNSAINRVLKFMEGRDDTLLIVSADHETGGFGFAYSRADLPKGVPLQGNVFKGDDYKPQWNFGDNAVLDKLYQQKLSYTDLFAKFDALGKENKTPENLVKVVNENTAFPITVADAKRILEEEENNYRVKGHEYLDRRKFPRFDERKEFFVYGSELRKNLLAVVTARQTNTVWATDNHTSTPVYVFAYGPQAVTKPFATLQHSTDWANKVIKQIQ